MWKTERIDRVAVAVRNLEEAMAFFHEMLGIKFDDVRENEANKWRACYSDIGLELVQPTSSDSPVSRFIEKKGEGILAIALKVSNIDAAKRFCQEKGLRAVNTVRRGRLKEVVFHPKDFHGVQVTLCEYQALHPATCAALH